MSTKLTLRLHFVEKKILAPELYERYSPWSILAMRLGRSVIRNAIWEKFERLRDSFGAAHCINFTASETILTQMK